MMGIVRTSLCAFVTFALVAGATPAAAKLSANKLAANKLSANKLAANKLAANKLAANKLAANAFGANPEGVADLLATDEGREVLGFFVSCALPEGVTLTATANGEEYQFFGEIGLVKSWLKHPLNKAGRGWISACMLARVNDSNVPIPISLRGPHSALAASDDEKAGWSLEEGTFYGDIFVADPEPVVWVACRGEDQAAGETGGLIERDCAEPDAGNPGLTQCGFTYAGDCGDFAASHACKKFSKKGFYQDCQAQPIVKGVKKFHQVITTFATP